MQMQERAKTFILGLGHQKCGTIWLYRYLSGSPAFAEGFIKEYHVWDAIDIEALDRHKARRPRIPFRKTPQSFRYKMQNSKNFYFDYFASLFTGTKSITADITPSYSGLDAKRLADIKGKFSAKNVHVKVVILMREPLSRIKSAVRFNLDRDNFNEGIQAGEVDFSKALRQYYKTDHCAFENALQLHPV